MAFRLDRAVVCALLGGMVTVGPARAEVILQYFNTSWNEIALKMPELAEAGYGALWLPPPTKGSGGLSVGYDSWDFFDLGGKDQRGTVKTRYGTEAELLRLIETAHRFGIRVYFDNIMNHRAFDIPGYNESTPIDLYPGLVPEDFHLRTTEDGFYRKWDNVADWNDAWQVQYRNFSDLIDIAMESSVNGNFGATEGSTHPKISFVRQPFNPEYYDYHPTLGHVGFYSTNITAGLLASNAAYYSEDVGGFLIRAVRWLMDRTKVDGLRLDAVKHVPSYFFGAYGDDGSTAGYCGQAQWQFNMTRGYSDWDNHRDTLFDTDKPRNDAMMFGEHLGAPPGYSEYISAGMRLVDSTLKGRLNGVLGNPSASLAGLDAPGTSGDPAFNQFTGVMFAKSHDDDYATRPELHYGYYLTRQGLPNIYTDGNYQSETLAQSGGAFPRHANTSFLGQFGDNRIPNLVYIHEQFARGGQRAKWSDGDVVAYERYDDRENTNMSAADATTLLFMMNDNYASGAARAINTTFPNIPFNGDAYLYNYSTYGGGFYTYASQIKNGSVIIPPGGYFAFSWRSPEEADEWKEPGGKPVMIYENGRETGWVSYERKDGPNGDPGFNPYGTLDTNSADFAYTWFVPRVTSATNLRFVARVDGSAANVLLKLDGGVDLNSHMGLGDLGEVAKRDNPPGIFPLKGTDQFQGYEQPRFVLRQFREKFAARNTVSNNVIGSAGAETYTATIGSAGFVVNAGATGRNSSNDTAQFVYHDPAATITASNQPALPHFYPAPETAAGSNIALWVKVGVACEVSRGFVYYTTDGQTWPEGAGGEGVGNTQVAEAFFVSHDQANGLHDWWRATLPPLTNGTPLRYKIGLFKQQGYGCTTNDWTVQFPSGAAEVARKKTMMGVWEITNYNAAAAVYRPHNDYGAAVTGLVEGFHVLRARAFLDRANRASIYNTFTQPFYYDAERTKGAILFPSADFDDLKSQEYGVLVRSDATVTKAWYNIQDSNPANDDAQTGKENGNGTNAAGQVAWALATSETPSLSIQSPYPLQWRFAYRNIPASGVSTIAVKLVELSSSTNLNFSDVDGHYTTLTRLADAMAPTQELYVAYPPNDGDLINDQDNYVMQAYFSKSLEANADRFLIRIDGSAQPRSQYAFYYDVDANHHALAFPLPDLFSGNTNTLHTIEVTHTTGGGVELTAYRTIRSKSEATGPYVAIVSPPEVDSDGKAYVITLPDVASPTPEQRQVPILVETDLTAKDAWIEFANNAGGALKVAEIATPVAGVLTASAGSTNITASEKLLAGTVIVIESNNLVTGSGTSFTNDLRAGQTIRIDTNQLVITQIVSQTSLYVGDPYDGASATGLAVALRPRFDVDFQPGTRLGLPGHTGTVAAVASATALTLTAPFGGASSTNLTGYRLEENPIHTTTRLRWSFVWTNVVSPGYYTFYARVDTNGVTNTVEASATRNVTVVFRQIVASNTNDLDDDDDGLFDDPEVTATNHPSSYQPNSELWLNGWLHIYNIYGKTDALSPDSDGDGLPDGLESGWRTPISSQTDTNADTNGDGWKNFLADLDPPFYNTLDNYPAVPGVNSQTEGGDRSRLVRGSMTSAGNPDSDYDGIPDGVEDRNRNGWLDGDGSALGPTQAANTRASWPNGQWTVAWTETDPNNYDSDRDGMGDGAEDGNRDGAIAGDTNSNRIWNVGEVWTESNPLNPDTDGDGLPDGWENQYGFDPLDQGVIGQTNLRGVVIGSIEHGASGNPDADVICNTSNAYVNLLEYQNGDNPRYFDSCTPLPPDSITIGRGPVLGVINGVTNYQEFTDWTWDDLIVLDEYEGDGGNNQGGDQYLAYDGWDTSRDVVAFYARDGGPSSGRFYLRLDFHDLQPLAEEGNLDFYVVIDTGNPAAGEMALPDDVDLVTSCRWEVVVAGYQSGQGAVYVDTIPTSNSTLESHGGNLTAFGVQRRDQSSAVGFLGSYYNSELDAVEFAISRQALIDAGWNQDAGSLNYQVYVTKDGTANSPLGAGDIGGRNDVRDTIYDDHVAEDYWQSQPSIQNALVYYFNRGTFAGRAKTAVLLHGNQAIQPASIVQGLINNGAGAGYHRPLAVHEVFGQPLNLHLTPTLATALEWAKADPAFGTPWRDGPLFNDEIASLVATGVVRLLGSSFADHAMPYFTTAYNQDNVNLSREVLGRLYDAGFSGSSVFWTPERVLDADVLSKIQACGFYWTVVDQNTHLFTWLGRNTSLGEAAYKINQINGVKCFAINDGPTSYRFSNSDGGLPTALRSLYSRKARAGSQDQVITLFSNWEDFGVKAQADAYDRNVRWMANHPWVALVGLDQIAAGQVDLGGDGTGDSWYVENRGNVATNKVASDAIQHSANGNFDAWYVGSALEEALSTNRYETRPGTRMARAYGMQFTTGVATDSFTDLQATADTNVSKLARVVYGASLFQTAFHNEDNNNLSKYSIGTYVYPDTSYDTLADFARQAQGQTRYASVYERVDDWLAAAGSMTNVQATQEDVDLDGEDEYLLYNDRVFGVFERVGGRLVGVWLRDILQTNQSVQVLGNFASFPGSATEEEGASNVIESNGVLVAYRTSGLKDWFVNTVGNGFVNMPYDFTNWTNGWRAAATNGLLRKTVTLAPKSWTFEVQYQLLGGLAGETLYLRHGLSPNLWDLLVNGQATLTDVYYTNGVATLANTNYLTTVRAEIGVADAGHNAGYNALATDRATNGVGYYAVRMRNQAQTQQVELFGTGGFSFALSFRSTLSDWDGDGIPNVVEDQAGLNATNEADADLDSDGDGVSNADEWLSNTQSGDSNDFLRAVQTMAATNGLWVSFPGKPQREYRIWYADQGLVAPAWILATTGALTATNTITSWLDNGTQTAPHPFSATNRFYQIKASLPP